MSKKRYVDIKKNHMISTLDMYIGNLLVITNGKGEVSDIKHIVIRDQPKSHCKPKYINIASIREVIVGGEVSLKENHEILINAKCLAKVVGENYMLSDEVIKILYKINGKEKTKEYIRNNFKLK